jgi:glycosyltransferase involved in cell wall biosynthesis
VTASHEGLPPREAEVADDDALTLDQGSPRYGVTVLMPVKDPHPVYLAEALASVVGQSSPQWRLIIVVEPSDLVRISAELVAWTADPRIGVVANEGPRLAGAINTGMRRAETEFVALLLGDDLWHPDAVLVLEDSIQRFPEIDFFHSARRIIDDHGQPISPVYPARPNVTLADFFTDAPVKHLLCWRRSLGLAVGGLDERSRSVGPDDFDFPWTMAEHGARFQAVDVCLYVYRDHRDGVRLTTHLPLSVHLRELRRVFRKHGMNRRQIRHRIRKARQSYLQQCLYRSTFDERVRRRLGRPPHVWRDTYR